MTVSAGVVYVDISPQVAKSFGNDLQRQIGGPVDVTAKQASGSIAGVAGKLAALAGGAFAAVQVGSFFKGAISGASDLNETLSKSNTVFGESGKEIEKWAKGAATSVGLSKVAALDAAGTFGNMFTQLGIGQKEAAKMSTSIVGLAADFASFHNADISEVVAAQSAAFRGEYDSLQRFLPLINAATVEQKALAMTHKTTTKELTAQDKALAVNALMQEGAGKAAGDFARTSDGLANKQRVLAARFEDIKTSIGTALLPVVLNLTTAIADGLEPAMAALGRIGGTVIGFFQNFAKQLGNAWAVIKDGQDVAQGLGETLDNAFGNTGALVGPIRSTVEWIMKLWDGIQIAISAFKEFGLVGGDFSQTIDSLVGGGGQFAPVLETIFVAVKKVSDFIGDNLKPILIGLGITVAAVASPFLTAAAAVVYAYLHFETFRNIVGGVVDFLLSVVIPAVVEVAGYFIEQFGNLVSWVQQFWPQISEAIGHVMVAIETVIRTVIALVTILWHQWGDDLLRYIRTVWNLIRETIENAIQLIKGVIQTVMALINGDWGKAWDGIKNIVGAIWDQIGNVISTAAGTIKSVLGGVASSAGEAFAAMVEAIVKAILSIPGKIANVGKDILSKLIPDLPGSGIIKDVLGKLPGFASGGVVSGPIGRAQLAVVHGGEEIISADGRAAGSTGGPLVGQINLNGTRATPREALDELAWYEKAAGF